MKNSINPEKHENIGLTTETALKILHDDIHEILVKHEQNLENESFFTKLKTFTIFFGSPLSWFTVFSSIFCVTILLFCGNFASSMVILVVLCFTIYLQIRENGLRKTEMHRKVRAVLADLQSALILCESWDIGNYPHIYSPLSPCVSLQWTYRNGRIVNLPWAILAKGDYIIMRPGQLAPDDCTEMTGKCKFSSGEVYRLVNPLEAPLKPTARPPLPDLICILDKTPFCENLQTALNNFLNRPSTIYDQQRDSLVTKVIQQYGFIFVLITAILIGLLRYTGVYFEGKRHFNWKEVFLESAISCVLPILPLVYPIIWTSINLWGMARLQTALSIPHSMLQSEQQKSFQEDLDTPTLDLDRLKLPRKNVFYHWLQLIKGDSKLLGRSTNVVQVLGTVTALCCVDKKGILSWPNPTAEKVFFLREHTDDVNASDSSLSSASSDPKVTGPVAEVLDLTHDQHSPFKLDFDDHEWKNQISSLKPLGLAVLVNTCCPLTQAHYTKFSGHISAQFDKNLVPVTNRYHFVEARSISSLHGRCLCELAKQIGFTQQARNIFSLCGQISSYRHLQPDVVKRDMRFAKSLHISKVKVPFPHALSVVVRETPGGSLQLFSQGTADLILDCCDDYWNGKDLRPLMKEDRKRALDFYQRNALTAYCTAFSYRPLRHGIHGALAGDENVADVLYLELPPESKYRLSHIDKGQCDYDDHPLAHSLSTDSLLFSENREEDVGDVDGCFEMQSHQVFIGMVTMQYQAQTDIVQLIERLDRACIRFVHFSKENELRSRVFSEKMGLESGWNCHISLLSDDQSNVPSPKNSGNFATSQMQIEIEAEENHRLLQPGGLETSKKTLSSSAPCAIQDTAVSVHNSDDSFEMDVTHRASKDSAMEENCRSLSCLTDSTEQSMPLNFDMSNRAKLPRGIENIRPHLENVDDVPLLVSLFTDCSAEATREMLQIMQQYGEIVVCLGSSASNANCEIFLQADCSIAIEPLYPQVCQDYPSYTESNIYNNFSKLRKPTKLSEDIQELPITISPIYLSRILNSLPCSISFCRDDPLSFATLIELSRRFTIGLWNCLQFLACSASSFALLNLLAMLITLPPILTPAAIIYLMCVAVPLLSVSLVRIEPDALIMNRATGKKQSIFNINTIIFVVWCYGCKFIPMVVAIIFSFCSFLSHPVIIITNENENFEKDLELARSFVLLAVIYHLVVISSTFVHRDYSIWVKNPLRNICWVSTSGLLVFVHTVLIIVQIATNDYFLQEMERIWPIFLFLCISTITTFVFAEFFKWEEIKVNCRYQRRARLDFGTKLGMNSPF